jgi:Skp family chaperone for outer membrane proteins
MKLRILATCLGLGLVAATTASAQTTTAAPADKPTINQRLENQKDRIQAGTKDDQLTKGERTKLRANDAAIHAQEKVYRRANDGKLTAGERRQLNRELNRNSRQIHRDRHNNRKPRS